MNIANPETATTLLAVLTLVAVLQFLLLVGVLIAMKSMMARMKLAMSLLVGTDIKTMHGRLDKLLTDVETLVTKGNTVLGVVEQGAQDLSAAASAAGATAKRALALGTIEARAATTAVTTGLRWFLNGRGWRRPSRAREVPLPRLGDPRVAAPGQP